MRKFLCEDDFRSSDKTRIKNDWSPFFPDMDRARKVPPSMIAIQRVVGPLLMGVYLEIRKRFSDYKISYSIFPLIFELELLGADLSAEVWPKEHEVIDYTQHGRLYKQAVESVKKAAWVPVDGPISLDDIFNGYSRAAKYYVECLEEHERFGILKELANNDEQKAKMQLELGRLPNFKAGTPSLVAAWAGEEEKAKEYFEWGRKVCMGGEQEYIIQIKPLMKNPELLRKTARSERIRFRAEKAPYQDIVGVPYKETWSD